LKHKVLHLTSEEFTALAELEVRDEEDARTLHKHFTYNRVITVRDQVKGLFMIYNLKAPPSFKLSDYAFLEKMVAAKDSEADAPKPNPNDTGWQLLMQGVTHLVSSPFPLDNGWEKVSTKDCTLDKDADGDNDTLRIVFGTDRKIKSRPQGESVKDPDALLDTEPGRSLHIGCAFISKSAAKSASWSELIENYRLLRESKPGDLGDHLNLRDETGRGRGSRSDALLFIHGYNVPFKYALQTIGTIVAETGYKGRVYMYSWPSAESTVRYAQDLDRAEQAEPYFQSFMRMLMRDANINEIDLLAHSMGSQTLLRAASALRPIFETTRVTPFGEKKIRIGQLIFAAPDVDRSVFDQKLRRVAPYAKRVTIYVSSSDAALLASKLLRGGVPRVGEIERAGGDPVRIDHLKNVHVIDATGKESWWRLDRILRGYGHDYLQQAKEVRDDIGDLLKADRKADRLDPSERDKAGQRFTKHEYADAPGVPFWRINAK
jgi:esterase/lipase superfamily enzyme